MKAIILIAATNRPDVLDPALMRPGRFDRQVVVPNPDVIGREKILKVHVRNVPLAPNVDLKVIARGTPGLLRRRPDEPRQRGRAAGGTAQQAPRHHGRVRGCQGQGDDGCGTPLHAMTEEEKQLTAYHEAGHAIVALNVPSPTRCTRRRSSRAAVRSAW
jgi:cell division protease FtsH